MLRPLTTLFTADKYPDLLVGLERADDAAVYRLNDEQALVQTVDFFAPIVDDPWTFGAIAAVNAMSDVWAMGGEVLLALNVAAFPEDLDRDIVAEIFRGGAEMVAQAGGVIAGGHSIFDTEPKYGLSVTGMVHPDRITTKTGATPGNQLYLTKPLGAGLIATAGKRLLSEAAWLDGAIATMLEHNRTASRLALAAGVTTMTDVTGFGLLGHLDEMLRQAGAGARLSATTIPALPGARECIALGIGTGGASRNRAFVSSRVQVAEDVADDTLDLLYDPQTSGGLLMALAPEHCAALEAGFADAGLGLWRIGEVTPGTAIVVQV